MQMRLVDAPSIFPFSCPDGTSEGPLVDTMLAKKGPMGHLYLSRRMVREAAGLFGLVEPEEHRDVVEKLADANQAIVDLEAELAELQPVRDALALASARYGDVEADDEPVRQKKAA